MGQKIDYLFKNRRSQNWYARFQYPKKLWAEFGRVREFSTRTPDRIEAQARILDAVREHRARILAVERRRQPPAIVFTGRQYTDGHTTLEDGTIRIVAGEIVHLIKDGQHTTALNLPCIDAVFGYDPETPPPGEIIINVDMTGHRKPKPAPRYADDERMVEAFLGAKTRHRHYDKECRDTWAEFRAFVGGRPMQECTHVDGRAFADHLRTRKDNPLKLATVIKKINFLASPLRHDVAFSATHPNPFERAISEHVDDDAKVILPLSTADMVLFRDTMLPRLGRNERLLWLCCATMGLRHSEAFQITGEELTEDGIRFVKLGKKTKASLRSVPLPDCLMHHPDFPERITGPLFDNSCKNVSKNLLRALRRSGITHPQKNVYSLRHRAHDRLDEMDCPDDVQRVIVGHTLSHRGIRKDPHDRYGLGKMMHKLKPWVDQIGF